MVSSPSGEYSVEKYQFFLHANTMLQKSIPWFYAFIIVLIPLNMEAADIQLCAGLSGGAVLTKTEDMDAALQPSFGIEGGIGISFNQLYSIELGLGETWISETYISTSGWLYRGYRATTLTASFLYTHPVSIDLREIPLSWGIAGGGGASLAVYTLAYQYFFYPSLFIEPFLETILGSKAYVLRISSPLVWNFAADRDISFEGRITLGFVYTPKKRTP